MTSVESSCLSGPKSRPIFARYIHRITGGVLRGVQLAQFRDSIGQSPNDWNVSATVSSSDKKFEMTKSKVAPESPDEWGRGFFAFMGLKYPQLMKY